MYRYWSSREKEDWSTKLGRMSLRCRASEGLSVNCWLIVFRSPPWSQIINDVSKIIEISSHPPPASFGADLPFTVKPPSMWTSFCEWSPG